MKFLFSLICLFASFTTFAAQPLVCSFYNPAAGIDWPDRDMGKTWFKVFAPTQAGEVLNWQYFDSDKEVAISNSFVREMDPVEFIKKAVPFIGFAIEQSDDANKVFTTREITEIFLEFSEMMKSESSKGLDKDMDEAHKAAANAMLDSMISHMKIDDVGSIKAYSAKTDNRSDFSPLLLVFFDKQGNVLEKWTKMGIGNVSSTVFKCSEHIFKQ